MWHRMWWPIRPTLSGRFPPACLKMLNKSSLLALSSLVGLSGFTVQVYNTWLNFLQYVVYPTLGVIWEFKAKHKLFIMHPCFCESAGADTDFLKWNGFGSMWLIRTVCNICQIFHCFYYQSDIFTKLSCWLTATVMSGLIFLHMSEKWECGAPSPHLCELNPYLSCNITCENTDQIKSNKTLAVSINKSTTQSRDLQVYPGSLLCLTSRHFHSLADCS